MKLFRRKKDREEIQRELRIAGAAVEKSKGSGADSTSVRQLLEKARVCFEDGKLEEARTYISRAEKHADMLGRKYLGARKSIAELFKRIQKMKELGMNTYEFEAYLAKAKKRMEETIEENGVSIPNYGGARRIATKAAKIALKEMREYESASNAIFVANMILENTMKSMVYVDEETLKKKVFAEVIALLQRADERMKSGDLKEAYEVSVDAERRVETLKRSYQEAGEAYKSAENSILEGREKGIRSSELAKLHEAAGQALVDGNFESARLKSIEVSSEMRSLEDRKKRAKDMIEKAENAVEAAKNTGFDASESQHFLDEAKWAYERGIFQRAINCGEDALKKATKISSIHVRVTEDLEKTKKKVNTLRELGIAISNELEDVIEKAEKDLLMGDYVNSNEELMIARVLIGTLERKHHDILPEGERDLETA
ncbi:MAG: hypothetical protein ACE5QW_05935 [Thermoplasmata archaeon]